jgi:hypothetical protein
MKVTINKEPKWLDKLEAAKDITNIVGWSLVAISFFGGTYICWLFGHTVASPLARSLLAYFFPVSF